MKSRFRSTKNVESLDDISHPILGNFLLPVNIEGVPKVSGVQNLLREGWDEASKQLNSMQLLCDADLSECRNFLVGLYGWVPRNFNYADGLRIIHPMLQDAFGDENLDLALGVLEELIEVEAPPPFPEAVYQRWKYSHLKRRVCLRPGFTYEGF